MAIGTFEPGMGFESMTVPATMVLLAGAAAVGAATWLLRGRPTIVSLSCLVLGGVLLFGTYLLTRDIPGRPSGYPGRAGSLGDPALYTSRITALWLLVSSGVALCVFGVLAVRDARGAHAADP